MKNVLPIGALLLAAVLSTPAHAAPADDLGLRLDRVCAAVPAPGLDGKPVEQQGRAIDAYAAAVADYQDCLHRELRASRASLTQSEQAMIAGRLSRSAYDLTAVRLDYAGAIRASRAAAVQVAERTP
ncbi:hypothetical protein IP70_15315 [alpha proteobacterium AAP38]|nr:hypothetical protein IP70_15315 [alpha proteobacterium AAP38]